MKPNDRQRLCPHCDATISVDVVICPYCTADLSDFSQKEGYSSLQAAKVKNQTLQESVSSLYTPPYAAKGATMTQEDKYRPRTESFKEVKPLPQPSPIDNLQKVEKGSFLAIFLLSLGGVLLILGALQFFFGENGLLTLEWDTNYWFAYCIVALPLLFFGLKKANVPEQQEK